MRILIALFLAAIASGQNPNTAAFPTTVATDQNLGVAKRVSSSTLSGSINSSTLTVNVASGAAFLEKAIITIDNEEMQICTISSNTLTICTGTRGFNGTTAASHTVGAAVRATITSHYINQAAAEIKAMQTRLAYIIGGVVASGATNAYTGCPSPPWGSYIAEQTLKVVANAANTGAATMNVCGLGPKTIKKLGGGITTDLAANDIRTGQWFEIVYDGTNFQMLSQLGNAASGGGAWGTITGTLGSQTDLQAALDAKVGSATAQAGTPIYCRSTSGSATYVCSVTPALTAYTRGGCLVLDADTGNTTTATVNVNTLGAKSILNRAGSALNSGDITANKPITVCYDGTQYIIQGDGVGTSGGVGAAVCTASNASSTYTCTGTITSYTDGMEVVFIQTGNASPSNPSTVNINGTGAANIKWSLNSLGDSHMGVGGICVPYQNVPMRLVYSASATAFIATDCVGMSNAGVAVRRVDLITRNYDICAPSQASSPFTCTTLMGAAPVTFIGIRPSAAAITAAATINIDGAGAVSIVQPDGVSNPSPSCSIPQNVTVDVELVGGVYRMKNCPNARLTRGSSLCLEVDYTVSPPTMDIDPDCVPQKIASGTATLGTSAISSGACASVVTVSATGVATTDVISFTPNADISGVTGYAPVTTGGLTIYPYPTTNNVNFKVCNATSSSITPGSAVVLNFKVTR